MGTTKKKKNKTGNSALNRARGIQPASPVNFEITINGATSGAVYLGWTPNTASVRISNPPRPAASNVILANKTPGTGGQLVFRSNYADAPADTLALTLPADGSAVNFFVAGKFGQPSVADNDAILAVTDAATNSVLSQRTMMVRIRKNANTLTTAERDRFLAAYKQYNNAGNPGVPYQVFLTGHDVDADSEIHQRPSFLVWHRAFTLDLERQLQAIDPSVALPYWKFDEPAPNLFTPDFIGGPPIAGGQADFSATNPLAAWTARGNTGVVREPGFDVVAGNPTLLSQAATLGLGTTFINFRRMENDPHGSAHVSFNTGPITSPPTATEDPIFFLLHCNVDRLWAVWQKTNTLWDSANISTYNDESTGRPGDAVADTMWPWNGVSGPPRPPTAPGGAFPQLTFPSKPSPQATVGEMIDYLGVTQGNSSFFDYDDVQF